MGGNWTRIHYQGPHRDPDPARDRHTLYGAHRRQAASSVSARGAGGIRTRRPPLVSRGVPAGPRIPALCLCARDVRARNHEELPPDRPVLVLSADRPGRGISLDRARARTPEELALGLACPPSEPGGAGGYSPGVLGAGTSAVLHAESVEAAAVRIAGDAAVCARGRATPDATIARAGRRHRRRKTHLRGDRGTVRRRARVPDDLAPRADQPDAGRAGRDSADRAGVGDRIVDLGGVGLVRRARGAAAPRAPREGSRARRGGGRDRGGAAAARRRPGPPTNDDWP